MSRVHGFCVFIKDSKFQYFREIQLQQQRFSNDLAENEPFLDEIFKFRTAKQIQDCFYRSYKLTCHPERRN